MKKVLIIDDEKDFCAFVKMNLELTGLYSVTVATTGAEGIAEASRCVPEIILLDVMMPDMSGFDALREIKGKKATASIPVVMLTAISTDEAKAKATGLYNEDYLVKPIAVSELRAKIDGVLSRRF